MAYIGQQFGLGRPESFVFTASGGETSVSTADDGRSIVYTPGTVTVFLNGVRLVEGTDYTATSGSGVSGLSALVSGDVLVVVVLASQSVANLNFQDLRVNDATQSLSSLDSADELAVFDDSAGVTKGITQAGLADFGSNTLTAGLVNATGVNFGADTLDDYEEGTFNPIFDSSDGTASFTYNTNSGQYVRVGDLVHINGEIDVGTASGTLSNINIENLPFLPIAGDFQAITFGFTRGFSPTAVLALVFPNSDRINLRGYDTTSVTGDLDSVCTASSSSRIMFAGTYRTS